MQLHARLRRRRLPLYVIPTQYITWQDLYKFISLTALVLLSTPPHPQYLPFACTDFFHPARQSTAWYSSTHFHRPHWPCCLHSHSGCSIPGWQNLHLLLVFGHTQKPHSRLRLRGRQRWWWQMQSTWSSCVNRQRLQRQRARQLRPRWPQLTLPRLLPQPNRQRLLQRLP